MSKIDLTQEEMNLLNEYAKHDMNVEATGRKVYKCGRSVRYEFKKIIKKTGLNPECFFDLVKLLGGVIYSGKR